MLLICSVAVNGSNGCPNGKGVCVKKAHCLDKFGDYKKLMNHKCFMDGNKPGVCCNKVNSKLNKKCTTSKGVAGQCVPKDQCGGYTRDFLLGNEKEDRWKSDICHQDNRELHYCCPPELQKHTPVVLPRKPVQPWNDNAFPTCLRLDKTTGRCVPMILCENFRAKILDKRKGFTYGDLTPHYKCYSNVVDSTSMCCAQPESPNDLIRHRKANKLHPNSCGAVGLQDRVLAGNEANLGEFPWMANLMYYVGFNKTTMCSGTLIHAQYVLTAAHCLKRYKPISVRLGEHDLSTKKDCMENVCAKQFREYAVAELILHQKYRNKAGMYDIGLVKLANPATIIPGQIFPICLPITEQWLMTKPSELIASGWGLMESGRYPDVLRYATLQSLKKRPDYCGHEQMICARGANKEGHCRGDSGGPMQQIMRYGDRFRIVLFGVISGGAKKCTKEDSTAGVSVLVGYHMKWILDNMEI